MELNFFQRMALLFTVLSINIIYIFPVVETIGHGTGYSVQRIAAALLISSSILLMVFSGLMSLIGVFIEYLLFTKITYLMFTCWCLVVVMKSVSMSLGDTWQMFNRADGAGPWFVPFVMLLGGQIVTWQRLNIVFLMHTVGAIFLAVIVVLFFKNETSAFRPFAFYRFGLLYASGFLLLTWRYQRPFARKVGIVGVLTYGFIAFLALARHGLVTTLYVLFVFMLVRQLQVQGLFNKIKGVYLKIFGILVIVVALATAVYASEYVAARYNKFLNKFGQDSRSMVIKEFVKYAKNSEYLITGSGAMGTYKTYLFRGITKRENIENGYLQLVHKGGIVMLVLFLFMAIPAALMGILRSSNWFTRITGFLVLGRLIDMFPYGIPWTDSSYILFWLCVGACLSPQLRRMCDADISLHNTVLKEA